MQTVNRFSTHRFNIYINIFSLFAHFPQNPSVGLSVGDLSAVPTDEGSARVLLSHFSTEADASPTLGGLSFGLSAAGPIWYNIRS